MPRRLRFPCSPLHPPQVPLTSDSEIKGGRLVFLGNDGAVDEVERKAGVPLTHNGGVVHGVSRLDAPSVRYGLFAMRRPIWTDAKPADAHGCF